MLDHKNTMSSILTTVSSSSKPSWLFALSCFSKILTSVAMSPICGQSTYFDKTSEACICDSESQQIIPKEERMLFDTNIRLLGLFDTENFDWGRELFDYTLEMINDPDNGWYDEILDNDISFDWDVKNAACDGTKASRAYWEDRTDNDGVPPHGLVGCRCSSASIAVARVSGLEGVPQVSPASTSKDLSDKSEFPFFARTVSSKETKALVAMLRGFGFDRVSILQTNTPFAASASTSFQRLWTGKHKDKSGEWEGEIAYSHTMTLNQDESVDEGSVRQALNGVPTDDPINNSRVILLFAHDQHAFSVLKIAAEMGFQPDTIWIGVAGWANRQPSDTARFPHDDHPGYLGITPYVNQDENYFNFLDKLQEAQSRDGKMPWPELPDYAAQQMVDSILALAMALAATPPENRRDGEIVMSNLLSLDFAGVSGRVKFTPDGDRDEPLFSIFNYQHYSLANAGETASWVDVGSVGSEIGSADIDIRSICFAGYGCGLDSAPDDSYPVPELPPQKLALWVPVVIAVIAVLLVGVSFKYVRVHRKKKDLASQMTEMQKKVKAMKIIDNELLDINQVVEEAKKRQAALIMKRAALQDTPSTWSDSLDTLVLVPPEDEEYWSVFDKMRQTIPDVYISSLWRVQNSSLWSYYSFHKDRLEMNNIPSNERRVWHGTSSLDPSVVYDDQMDGFMMQFAAQGLWGRGIYFADKASYSKNYSHTPANLSQNERASPQEGELEMFLTRLLIGKEAHLAQDRSLTVPPIDSSTGLKYNTVTGHTAGSQVWIVYENGRAYPEYLVRYYTGSRDKSRTPYESRQKAKKSTSWRNSNSFELEVPASVGSQPNSRHGFWEYLSDSGWVAYDSINQALIEKTFQDFKNNGSTGIVRIKGPEWEYEIDVDKKVQTNVQHNSNRQRDIRFCPA